MTESKRGGLWFDQALTFVSDVGVLGIVQGLARVRGLILLPVIARLLGTVAYGVWTQSLLAVSLGVSIVDLRLHAGLVRFVGGTSDEEEQRGYFIPVLIVVSGTGLLVAIATALLAAPLARHVLGDPSYLNVAAVLGAWIGLAAIGKLGLHMLRALQKVKRYGIMSTLHAFLQLLAVAGVVLTVQDLHKAVIAALIIEALFAAAMIGLAFKEVGVGWVGLGQLKTVLRFSLPLVPAYYGGAVLSYADRLMVASVLGAEAVGVYAAAYSLARVVEELYKPISEALVPMISRVWDRGEIGHARSLLSTTMRYYSIVAIPAVIGSALIAERFLLILAPQTVVVEIPIMVSFMAIGFLVSSLQGIFAVHIHMLRQTHLLALTRAISTPTYIIFLGLAVPRWGLVGASISTASGYTVDLLITSVLARRSEQFDIPYITAVKATFACLGMAIAAVLSLHLPDVKGLMLAILLAVLVYFGSLVLLGVLGRRELEFIGRALGSLRAFNENDHPP